MTLLRRAVSVGTLAAILGGCFDEGEEFARLEPPSLPPNARPLASQRVQEIFPLQPGARFDYGVRFGLGGGQFDGTAAINVLRGWRVDDREVYDVGVTATYFGRTRHDRYAFVRTGDWIGLVEPLPAEHTTTFLPTHLPPRAHWPVATGEGAGEASLVAREDLVLATGRYHACYRVRYLNRAKDTDITFWFAPAVGLVKADVKIRIGPLPLVGALVLTHFDPPQD